MLLKQPFAYEVYCPISCKKIKIGIAGDKMQFKQCNSIQPAVVGYQANVHGDIKYLVNGHNPTKKIRKSNRINAKVYVDKTRSCNV